MNKTEILLLLKYEAPIIQLDKVCEEYFGCSKGTAMHKAKAGILPVPVFRLTNSQKSPWMVHTKDLANFIEQKRLEAKNEWLEG